MIGRWLLLVAGIGLVSWALLTHDLARDTRAVVSLAGGTILVVGLAPARKPHTLPTNDPED